jgi:phosphonoacetate hydrolase
MPAPIMVRRLLGTFLLACFSVVATPILAVLHPAQITVNGKSYRWPTSPVVVILIDGGDPAYVHDGLARNLLPNFRRLMTQGFAAIAQGAMPSFTNPNNISVITGVPPSVHGISGNFFLNPATGQEAMMDQPEFLRADSILAKFSQSGAKVVAITAKNKLAKMLAAGLHDGITFSAEKANECQATVNGLADCLKYVGKPLPSEYSAGLSIFVLEAGVRILEREHPDLIYLSLSDYIQHKYAPGSGEARDFYVAIDNAIGRLLAAGATVALTADHGMNDKSNADGSPNVVFLQDLLDDRFGKGTTRAGSLRARRHASPFARRLSDRNVYLMFSRPLSDEYARIALNRQLRNFDAFDFVLNGLR